MNVSVHWGKLAPVHAKLIDGCLIPELGFLGLIRPGHELLQSLGLPLTNPGHPDQDSGEQCNAHSPTAPPPHPPPFPELPTQLRKQLLSLMLSISLREAKGRSSGSSSVTKPQCHTPRGPATPRAWHPKPHSLHPSQ